MFILVRYTALVAVMVILWSKSNIALDARFENVLGPTLLMVYEVLLWGSFLICALWSLITFQRALVDDVDEVVTGRIK
jgi:hypothetical protein